MPGTHSEHARPVEPRFDRLGRRQDVGFAIGRAAIGEWRLARVGDAGVGPIGMVVVDAVARVLDAE